VENNIKPEFHVLTMSTYGTGISGGDRIWIELSRRISAKYDVYVYLWEEGKTIAEREGLKKVYYILWSAKKWDRFGFFINYFARVCISIFHAFKLNLTNNPRTVVYSASEFWQDAFPAVILKLRYPSLTWVASWYQTAPHPFKGFREEGTFTIVPDFRAFLYWLVQLPIKPLIKKYADFVFVTSEPDKKHFPKQNSGSRVVVIKGGVDIEKANFYRKRFRKLPKIFAGVFQGRFHPQKGVLQLVDIWKMVVAKKPDAKLALIGSGPLWESVRLKVKNEKLEDNIKFFGWVFDGPKKYRIFSQSKIVVHPALYDSGGMAAAEAMAWGLPGVAFDLQALETYYPYGMIKVEIGDLRSFANVIIKLLDYADLYQKTSQDALKLIRNYWSWDSLVNRVLIQLSQNFYND